VPNGEAVSRSAAPQHHHRLPAGRRHPHLAALTTTNDVDEAMKVLDEVIAVRRDREG
jgi:hypothetical protein